MKPHSRPRARDSEVSESVPSLGKKQTHRCANDRLLGPGARPPARSPTNDVLTLRTQQIPSDCHYQPQRVLSWFAPACRSGLGCLVKAIGCALVGSLGAA